MKKKSLKFHKQEIADLSKEQQKKIIGGVLAPTIGDNCTVTCEGPNECYTVDYITGDCLSNYRGYECDPSSNVLNATCGLSAINDCHTDKQCTFAYCTDTCPNTYGDQTCKC